MLSFLENSLREHISFPSDAAQVLLSPPGCHLRKSEQGTSGVDRQEERQGERGFMHVSVCSFSRKSVREAQIARYRSVGSNVTVPEDEFKVGIIGGGHLGKQLAHVLLHLVPIPPERLWISTRRPEALGEEQCAAERGLGCALEMLTRLLGKRNPHVQHAEFSAF